MSSILCRMRNTPDPTSCGRHSLRPSMYMKAGCLIRKQGTMIRSVIPLSLYLIHHPSDLVLCSQQDYKPDRRQSITDPAISLFGLSLPPTSIDTSPVPPGVKRSYHFVLPLENTIGCSERCDSSREMGRHYCILQRRGTILQNFYSPFSLGQRIFVRDMNIVQTMPCNRKNKKRVVRKNRGHGKRA